MAVEAKFRIEGLRELEQALGELPKATAMNVLRRTLVKAGAPIESHAERAAPERKLWGGQLKRSAETGTKLSRRQRTLHKKEGTTEVFVGFGPLPQAHLEEFGGINNAARPFLRPAWDAERSTALDSIKKDLGDEIKKSADRLARKQARLGK